MVVTAHEIVQDDCRGTQCMRYGVISIPENFGFIKAGLVAHRTTARANAVIGRTACSKYIVHEGNIYIRFSTEQPGVQSQTHQTTLRCGITIWHIVVIE